MIIHFFLNQYFIKLFKVFTQFAQKNILKYDVQFKHEEVKLMLSIIVKLHPVNKKALQMLYSFNSVTYIRSIETSDKSQIKVY
jgi:hypothetical protein